MQANRMSVSLALVLLPHAIEAAYDWLWLLKPYIISCGVVIPQMPSRQMLR